MARLRFGPARGTVISKERVVGCLATVAGRPGLPRQGAAAEKTADDRVRSFVPEDGLRKQGASLRTIVVDFYRARKPEDCSCMCVGSSEDGEARKARMLCSGVATRALLKPAMFAVVFLSAQQTGPRPSIR